MEGLERPAPGQVGLGLVGVDLDGLLEPDQGVLLAAEAGVDLPEADQGADVMGVQAQRLLVLGLGLDRPVLELEDLAQAEVQLGRAGRLLEQQLQVGLARSKSLRSIASVAAWLRSWRLGALRRGLGLGIRGGAGHPRSPAAAPKARPTQQPAIAARRPIRPPPSGVGPGRSDIARADPGPPGLHSTRSSGGIEPDRRSLGIPALGASQDRPEPPRGSIPIRLRAGTVVGGRSGQEAVGDRPRLSVGLLTTDHFSDFDHSSPGRQSMLTGSTSIASSTPFGGGNGGGTAWSRS